MWPFDGLEFETPVLRNVFIHYLMLSEDTQIERRQVAIHYRNSKNDNKIKPYLF
jgi:hypothetical protein